MTDLVYVLGNGSPWADNELRFSLRSLQFLTGVGKVFVVGSKPSWLTNVIHLPFNDRFTCKEKNIMLKLAHACGHPDLSKTFLHVHDDHFCLYPQSAAHVPNWCGPSLERTAASVKNPRNHWRFAVINTYQALQAKGLPIRNFDLHYPMLFDKDIYPEIMDRYDWKLERGFVVKSLYGNTAGVLPAKGPDLKIDYRAPVDHLVARLKGRKWFSVGNQGLTGEFKKLLEALYPEASKYEK